MLYVFDFYVLDSPPGSGLDRSMRFTVLTDATDDEGAAVEAAALWASLVDGFAPQTIQGGYWPDSVSPASPSLNPDR